MREGKDGGGKGPLVSEDVSEDVSLTLATGNGQVLIQPVAFALRGREVAPTLNSMDNTGESRATVIAFSHTNGLDMQPTSTSTSTSKGHSSQSVMSGTSVRRLTPMEAERLQGFPDEWTKYQLNEKGEIVEQADSARYKQMGNAVTIPVVEWIMKRIVKVDGA